MAKWNVLGTQCITKLRDDAENKMSASTAVFIYVCNDKKYKSQFSWRFQKLFIISYTTINTYGCFHG